MIVKISYIILFVLLIAIILNSAYIMRFTEKLYSISTENKVADLDSLEKTYTKLNELYRKNEIFVSLTVSHEDLTNIESILAEMRGALNASDTEAVIIAKSRFENAVLHLGQLSAFNIESIF